MSDSGINILLASSASVSGGVEKYQLLSEIFLFLGAAFMAASLVFFFIFKIPHVISVLTGIGAKREAARIMKKSLENRGSVRLTHGTQRKEPIQNNSGSTCLIDEEDKTEVL
ncbi:hypothetical protein SAMN05216390_1036 [Lachnospiraceae bacterium KH1T2]|nr:hypothetical protein SAMN05216390_1036 [Lachnospiraceae bacterium KH1T2]